ncbi:hypothetical protein UlMin_040753 [Ulmus minor]
MDHLFLYSFLTLPVIFTIILIFYRYKSNLPPGSFGWPIIGETLAFMNQNHQDFISQRMKKHSSKIFKTHVLGEPMVVLCGTSGHKFVASNDEKLFRIWRPQSTIKLFRSSYQKTTFSSRTRKTETHIIKAPGFIKAEAVVRYVEVMDSIVTQHMDLYWEGKNKVEAYNLSQILALTLASRFFLGLDDQSRIMKFTNLLDKMMLALHIFPVNFPGTTFYHAMRAANDLREEMKLLIKETKEALLRGVDPQNILSHLIVNADPVSGEFWPEHVIADMIMGVLSGGFNSPAMTTTFIVKFLAERPDVCAKVRSEQMEIASSKKAGESLNWEDAQKMKYSWNVALEVMRLIPPLQGTFREAATDITYEGYTIPKGWKVYWTVSTTNMNPDYFPEPQEFDPTRYDKGTPPPYTNIPFGSGTRICPGKDYARLQILTFMHHLVRRFKLDLVNPNFKVLGGLNPIPTEGVHVRLQPYSA